MVADPLLPPSWPGLLSLLPEQLLSRPRNCSPLALPVLMKDSETSPGQRVQRTATTCSEEQEEQQMRKALAPQKLNQPTEGQPPPSLVSQMDQPLEKQRNGSSL